MRAAPRWFPRNGAWLGVLALAAVDLLVLVCVAGHARFDADEFQHAHIAWNVLNSKVPYRDFFDHHGPLFALVSSAALALVPDPARFDTFYILRFQAFAVALILLHATYLLSLRFHPSRRVAFLAVVLLSSTVFFADKASEIRPDALQNVWWVYGLCLLVSSTGRRARWWAGCCFAMCALGNMKGLLGPALAAPVHLLLLARRIGIAPALAQGMQLLAGFLLVFGSATVGFGLLGAADDFLFYNVTYNLHLASTGRQGLGVQWLGSMSRTQLPFLLVFLTGALGLVARGLRAGEAELSARAVPLLVSSVGLALVGCVTNMNRQFYLAVLPLMAVVGASGLFHLSDTVQGRFRWGRWIPLLLAPAVLFLCAGLVAWACRLRPAEEQRSDVELVLRETERWQPVGFLWSDCGAYVFNEDVQFYWTRIPDHVASGALSRAAGEDPFGAPYAARLEARQVPIVVARPDDVELLLPEVRAHLDRRYERRSGCLLVRRPDPDAVLGNR